jgi:hypothetical protein
VPGSLPDNTGAMMVNPQFIIKEARVSTNEDKIVFIDMEGVGHGIYHPDEYLGVGEELARKYAAAYGRQIAEELYRLDNML